LTYGNACLEERVGERIVYAGLCAAQGRNCPRVYQLVCGLNGIPAKMTASWKTQGKHWPMRVLV
jgi:hypothetical protein